MIDLSSKMLNAQIFHTHRQDLGSLELRVLTELNNFCKFLFVKNYQRCKLAFFAIIRFHYLFKWGKLMSNFRYIFMVLPLAFALNINAQSVGVLEEVVVTAQKKEENLQDTPIAITAITESTIDDLDLANVVDLAGMAPNVTYY